MRNYLSFNSSTEQVQVESLTYCPKPLFDCRNGKCISRLWYCDGKDDCGNGKDEIDCNTNSILFNLVSISIACPSRYWPCINSHLCIPNERLCDGHNDCPGGSDESNCTFSSECHGFQCINHECIPIHWRCDEITDCQDNSDELNCNGNHTHHPCNECKCIEHGKVCDNKKVCIKKFVHDCQN